MFRILKSMLELKRIQLIAASNTDRFSRITNITSRVFYLLYWLCDNLYIFGKALNTVHTAPKFPLERFKKMARAFWFMGLLLFLIYCCKTLRKTYTDESDLKVAALHKMTVK
mmetsp:Transcript_46773/g.63493  ORF Transcript_46773/g.63493 Transcript_46773/m.63493 type:complete len:112 (+) Transcript_46773:302-637(+)